MEENKNKYEELKEYMKKIKESMDLSKLKQDGIDKLTQKLYKETRIMMVEKEKEEIKIKEDEKKEFDEMTTQALLNAKKDVLVLKQNMEKDYIQKLLERQQQEKDIQDKFTRMMQRDLTELTEEKLKRLNQSRDKALEELKIKKENLQKEYREKVENVNRWEKDIETYAIKLNVLEKVEKVRINVVPEQTTPPTTQIPPTQTPPAQTPPAQTPPTQTPPTQTPPTQTPPTQTPPTQTPPTQTPPTQTPPTQTPPTQTPPTQTPPTQTPPAQTPPTQTPPTQTPPTQTPPTQTPPAQTPPTQTPPTQTPPTQTPPAQTPPAQTPPAQTPPAQTPPAQTPPAQTPPTPEPTKSKIEILVKGKKGIEIKFNNANNQYSIKRISSRKLRGNIDKLKDREKMKCIEDVVDILADEYRNQIYSNMSFLDNSILKAINIAYKEADDEDKEKFEKAMKSYVDGTIQKKLEKDIVDVTYYRSDLAKVNIPLFSKILGGRFSRKEKEYINNMSKKTENWTNSVGIYTKNPIKRYLEDRKTKKLPEGKNEMLDRLRGHRFFEGLEADKTEEEIERENRTRERIRAGREANRETSDDFERDD